MTPAAPPSSSRTIREQRSPGASPLFMLLALIATPAWAQSPNAATGRLFFTPEKRVALDRQRQLDQQVVQTVEGETLSFDGIVQRSDGQRTVWINRRAQSGDEASAGGLTIKAGPRQPGKAELVGADEGRTRLKVGETVNRSTGEYDKRLGGGSVEARPPR